MERLLYKHIQNDVSWSCGLASSGVYPAQVMLTHNALRRVHGRVVGTVFFFIRLTQDHQLAGGIGPPKWVGDLRASIMAH